MVDCDVMLRLQRIASLICSTVALIRVQQLQVEMDVHIKREEREQSCSHTICNSDVSRCTFILAVNEVNYI
jgi:hypothetical protein